MILKILTRTASNSRKMVAKAMRNIHVPVYCPIVVGVKAVDQRDVLVEWKKTIAIESIPIIITLSGDDVDMGMEPSVVEGMDIESVMVPDIDIDIALMEIATIQCTAVLCCRSDRSR